MKNVLSNLLFALLFVGAIAFVGCGEAADAAENAAETAGEAIENAAEAAGEAAENAAEAVSEAAENAAEATEEAVEGAVDAAKEAVDKSGPEYTSAYVCPMHCKGSGSAEAGKCPACKMDYVANAEHAGDGHDHGDHEGHNH